MKKSFATLALLVLVSCGGGGGGGEPPPPPPPPPPDPTAVELFTAAIQGLTLTDFFEVSFSGLLTRSQESVVSLTLDSFVDIDIASLNDLSQGYQTDTDTMYQLALDKLREYDRSTLSPADQLNYDIYEWYLQDNVDEIQFRNYGFVGTYGGFGIVGQTERFFLDLQPVDSAETAQDFLDRLSTFDQKFSQLEAWLLRMRDDDNVIESAITLQVALNHVSQMAAISAPEQPIYLAYRDKLALVTQLSTIQRANLRDIALGSSQADIVPAYQRLQNTLQTLVNQAPADIGLGQYPRGAEYYAYILRHHTTSNLTAAEIHQLGLDELTRIHAEMRVLFDQLGYPQNETLQELYTRVENDGGIVLAADARTTFENLIAFAEANLPQAFDIAPQAAVVVQDDPFGGFYIGPSFDGSRPGTFYAGTQNDQPYATMPTLTFHEALPGHHMQIALAMEQTGVPTFRKIVRSTGFVEGWALYAERLAFELGWYNNDIYGDLGRLQFEALRAARLATDTGIHDLGWGFDQATQFNEDNVGLPTAAAQGAAGRYSVIPGQATAYMVGMLQILSERQRAQTALGANFDLIAFHRAVLEAGGVPLSILPTIVDQYIADNTP